MLSCALKRLSITALALLAVVVSNVSLADPPGRVARISEFAGDVRVAGPTEGWQPAFRNDVITAGDNVWVSDGGRMELDVGPLQAWLSGGTNVYFERFDDHHLVARLSSGMVAVRIRQWEPRDSMRISTEHGEITFNQPGLYLVTAGDRYNPSSVTARIGEADVNTYGRTQRVSRDETLAFDERGVRFDRFAYSGVASGGFESWVIQRDRRIDRWEARHRGDFNPWMVGVRDLDDYGYWESSYEYGRVWYPNALSSSWAPYRNGRWSWVQPWGWTWVDDAPWGFAPFHYGRWVRLGGRWAWCPGSYAGRAVYAPALVTFYGGNGFTVSASVGPTYSWVPLGWNEPYVPWYTYSNHYWRNVNRPYVRNTAEDPWRPPAYVHASVPGAVTTIAAAGLIAGRHVTQHFVRNAPTPDLRGLPPARMSEVVPQFRGARFDPNPVVPQVTTVRDGAQSPVRVQESAPSRALPPAVVAPQVRERGPMQIEPNPNVAEPRVWQDPNPVVARSPLRDAAGAPPARIPPATVPAPVPSPVPVGGAMVRESAPVQVSPPPVAQPMQPAPRPSTQPPMIRETLPEVRSLPPSPPQPRERVQLQAPPAVVSPQVNVAPPARVEAQPQPQRSLSSQEVRAVQREQRQNEAEQRHNERVITREGKREHKENEARDHTPSQRKEKALREQ